jgi:hypothetical protein
MREGKQIITSGGIGLKSLDASGGGVFLNLID